MKVVKIFDSKQKADECLFPNKPFVISLNGLKICIIKNSSGLFAFKSQCPHSGADLADGFINLNNEIVCPLHGYRFGLIDGREKSGKECELHMYGIELREDGLFLHIR